MGQVSAGDPRVGPVPERAWARYRRIRLQALADSPEAFGSTLAVERALPDSAWQARTAPSARRRMWVAKRGRTWIGMVGALREEDGSLQLVSMWVDPGARRQGVARALIDQVVAWHRQIGTFELRLWVAAENAGARTCYAASGFRLSGASQPFPRDPHRLELEMRLAPGGRRDAADPVPI